MNTAQQALSSIVAVFALSAPLTYAQGAEPQTAEVETLRGKMPISCKLLGSAREDDVQSYTGLASTLHRFPRDPFLLSRQGQEDFINEAAENAGKIGGPARAQGARVFFKRKLAAFNNATNPIQHMRNSLRAEFGVRNLNEVLEQCRANNLIAQRTASM